MSRSIECPNSLDDVSLGNMDHRIHYSKLGGKERGGISHDKLVIRPSCINPRMTANDARVHGRNRGNDLIFDSLVLDNHDERRKKGCRVQRMPSGRSHVVQPPSRAGLPELCKEEGRGFMLLL